MKVSIVDLGDMDFTPDTPFLKPLGGMQSGAVYLSLELARRGHEITIINNTTQPGTYRGICNIGLDEGLEHGFLNRFDLVISIYCDAMALRRAGLNKPLMLWTGHNAEEPTVQKLAQPDEAALWDYFVFKSDWQAQTYIRKFHIDPGKCRCIGNAISPLFSSRGVRDKYFFTEGRPPVFYYSSTPFRGLDVLLSVFPRIRNEFPGSVLRVYSSMKTYQVSDEDDSHKQLYETCMDMRGVEYFGSVPQHELSEALRAADILAFPSTYPETACITLMEAMISGCLPISTDLGAMRETAAGFGFLYTPDQQVDLAEFAAGYSRFLIDSLRTVYANPARFERALNDQIQHAALNYSWAHRCDQWLAFLHDMLAKQEYIFNTRLPYKNSILQ